MPDVLTNVFNQNVFNHNVLNHNVQAVDMPDVPHTHVEHHAQGFLGRKAPHKKTPDNIINNTDNQNDQWSPAEIL